MFDIRFWIELLQDMELLKVAEERKAGSDEIFYTLDDVEGLF